MLKYLHMNTEDCGRGFTTWTRDKSQYILRGQTVSPPLSVDSIYTGELRVYRVRHYDFDSVYTCIVYSVYCIHDQIVAPFLPNKRSILV